jgi:hypothetical protein
MPSSDWRLDRSPRLRAPDEAEATQLDLFAGSGLAPAARPPASPPPARPAARPPPGDLDDAALIAALPRAGAADGPALALEAGRRGLVTAISALEELCRRFAGFGLERAVPEQVAALEAMAMIGGGVAARAVAGIIAKGAVQGPALTVAVAAAASLRSELPAAVVLGLLHHPDPGVRADACRCVRLWPLAVPALLDLRDDPEGEVSVAAACALGRLGRREVLPALAGLLQRAPSSEVIDAVTPIADEDCAVLLARIARTMPDLAEAALDALEIVDHPRAAQLLVALAEHRQM